MAIQNILLTGDDGYNSIGTRVLIHFLKKKYKLNIAATHLQQSGVGGRISLSHTINWRDIEVDGVKGFYVDGTPSDAIEVAKSYYAKKKFDLVVSGINLGVNIGGTFLASGTLAAAQRALLLGLSKKSIALSLHVTDSAHYLRHHDGIESIRDYIHYPGRPAHQLIEEIIANGFWGADLINVNFPAHQTNKVRFTKTINDLNTFYDYPYFNKKKKTFRYPFDVRKNKNPITTDAGAILEGYISVTPCKTDSLHDSAYEMVKGKRITLTSF